MVSSLVVIIEMALDGVVVSGWFGFGDGLSFFSFVFMCYIFAILLFFNLSEYLCFSYSLLMVLFWILLLANLKIFFFCR